MESAALEMRTRELGRELLAKAACCRASLSERAQDAFLTRALADASFRTRLLRLLDVLASAAPDLDGPEVAALVAEHLAGPLPPGPAWLRAALRTARHPALPPALLGRALRSAAGWFASRFITPPGVKSVRR